MYQRIKTPKMKMLEKTIPPFFGIGVLCSVRELINDKIPKLIAIFLYITIHIQFIIKTKNNNIMLFNVEPNNNSMKFVF